MKTLDTLVQDIYSVVSTKQIPEGVDIDTVLDQFAEGCKKALAGALKERKTGGKGYLRMSNIGKTDKYLYHHVNSEDNEVIQPHTYVKFLYGHLIEEMLLALAKLSGHTVTDEQKEVDIEGVKGHMDCKVDGVVIDIKSTSTHGFKKFNDQSLAADDPFGYIGQMKGYAHAEGQDTIGWLAMDKQNGHLCVLQYDLNDKDHPMAPYYDYDIVERIRHVKKLVRRLDPPSENCFDTLPDGKSGNMKLAAGCSYCPYKQKCYSGLRGFIYSTGVRWLAKVENEPKVPEIHG